MGRVTKILHLQYAQVGVPRRFVGELDSPFLNTRNCIRRLFHISSRSKQFGLGKPNGIFAQLIVYRALIGF